MILKAIPAIKRNPLPVIIAEIIQASSCLSYKDNYISFVHQTIHNNTIVINLNSMIRTILRHLINTCADHKEKSGIILVIWIFSLNVFAQTTSYNQLCNELQFSRAISDKWSGELYLGGTFSSTPYESKVLNTNIQRYFFVWGHYYFSPRWKFSSSFAYYYNKDVPDIGQYFSPEYRLTLQGIYYFHKTGYTLSTRMRGEFRYIMNEEGVFEDKYRYRQMLKFVKPLNSHVFRKGVIYFMTTEELLFKPGAKTKGVNFFDRNRLEIGAGYLINDDIQLEMAYLNEFIPRDGGNQIYNALELTLTINNLFPNLKKNIFGKSTEEVNPD